MSERTTLDETSRSRRTLTASPAMRARLGLVEAPPDETAATVEAISVTTEEKAERRAAVREVETLLRERWPVVFCVPRVPLAIGIHKQVLEAAGGDINPVALGRFMRWWVRCPDYLDAVAHGEVRRNLDGSPAGEPDEPQRREAARQVYGPRAEAVLARIAARRAAEAEAAP